MVNLTEGLHIEITNKSKNNKTIKQKNNKTIKQ